jgi:hypothetical protein
MDSETGNVERRLTKRCTVCGGDIVWKRWLDRGWRELKYCGAICRRKAVANERDRNERGQRFLTSGVT